MERRSEPWLRPGVQCLLLVAIFSNCTCQDPLPLRTNDTPAQAEPPDSLGSDGKAPPDSGQPCDDADGDGYGVGESCLGPDCDDADPALRSDGVRSCYSGPSRTRGVGACAAGTQTCRAGVLSACSGEVVPRAETCDAVDNDCDGQADEQVTRSCYGGPAGTARVGLCRAGTQTCSAGGWSACTGETTPSEEVCDAQDNNCNGEMDEQLARVCYSGPVGTAGVGVCVAGMRECADGQDTGCVGEVIPSSERCDGLDNNCNGSTDEPVGRFLRSGESQQSDLSYEPVDIIVVMDNSSSMKAEEIKAVEANIHSNFASILDARGVDYRVILLSRHGSASGSQSICVRPPLSGNTNCATPTTCPVNGPRFFHYSVEIDNHDSLERIINTYSGSLLPDDGCPPRQGGWSQWLRPGANREFLEITADETGAMNAAQFETALFALTPAEFGTATQRNYVFHSIVGLRENSPLTAPWLPPDPLVNDLCLGNGVGVNTAGHEYQKLSRLTGGLRYPICQYTGFDAIFTGIAERVAEGARLACSFTVPSVPSDSSMDNTSLELWPTNGGAVQVLQHVANAAACTSTGFYTVGTTVHLCPAACTLWSDDPTADIEVVFTCSNQVGATP